MPMNFLSSKARKALHLAGLVAVFAFGALLFAPSQVNVALADAVPVDLRISATAKSNFTIFTATPSATLGSNGKYSYKFSFSRTRVDRNGYILVSQLQSDNKYHIVARFPTTAQGGVLSGVGTVTSDAVFAPNSNYRLSYYSKPYGTHTADYVILRSVFRSPDASGAITGNDTVNCPAGFVLSSDGTACLPNDTLNNSTNLLQSQMPGGNAGVQNLADLGPIVATASNGTTFACMKGQVFSTQDNLCHLDQGTCPSGYYPQPKCASNNLSVGTQNCNSTSEQVCIKQPAGTAPYPTNSVVTFTINTNSNESTSDGAACTVQVPDLDKISDVTNGNNYTLRQNGPISSLMALYHMDEYYTAPGHPNTQWDLATLMENHPNITQELMLPRNDPNNKFTDKLLSPKGGEVWRKGSTVKIRWTPVPGQETVSIALLGYADGLDNGKLDSYINISNMDYGSIYIADVQVPNTGSYDWRVGDVITGNGITMPSGRFILYIETGDYSWNMGYRGIGQDGIPKYKAAGFDLSNSFVTIVDDTSSICSGATPVYSNISATRAVGLKPWRIEAKPVSASIGVTNGGGAGGGLAGSYGAVQYSPWFIDLTPVVDYGEKGYHGKYNTVGLVSPPPWPFAEITDDYLKYPGTSASGYPNGIYLCKDSKWAGFGGNHCTLAGAPKSSGTFNISLRGWTHPYKRLNIEAKGNFTLGVSPSASSNGSLSFNPNPVTWGKDLTINWGGIPGDKVWITAEPVLGLTNPVAGGWSIGVNCFRDIVNNATDFFQAIGGGGTYANCVYGGGLTPANPRKIEVPNTGSYTIKTFGSGNYNNLAGQPYLSVPGQVYVDTFPNVDTNMGFIVQQPSTGGSVVSAAGIVKVKADPATTTPVNSYANPPSVTFGSISLISAGRYSITWSSPNLKTVNIYICPDTATANTAIEIITNNPAPGCTIIGTNVNAADGNYSFNFTPVTGRKYNFVFTADYGTGTIGSNYPGTPGQVYQTQPMPKPGVTLPTLVAGASAGIAVVSPGVCPGTIGSDGKASVTPTWTITGDPASYDKLVFRFDLATKKTNVDQGCPDRTTCVVDDNMAKGITEKTVTGLLPKTTYAVRVVAVKGTGSTASYNPNSQTWECKTPDPNTPDTSGTYPNGGNAGEVGVCGSANGRSYPSTATSFGTDTLCAPGHTVQGNPSFPSPGNTAQWGCNYGGCTSSSSCSLAACSATRQDVTCTIGSYSFQLSSVSSYGGGCVSGRPYCSYRNGSYENGVCGADIVYNSYCGYAGQSSDWANRCDPGTSEHVTGSAQ